MRRNGPSWLISLLAVKGCLGVRAPLPLTPLPLPLLHPPLLHPLLQSRFLLPPPKRLPLHFLTRERYWRSNLMSTPLRGWSLKGLGLRRRPPIPPLLVARHRRESKRQALLRPLTFSHLKTVGRAPLQPHLPPNCLLFCSMPSKASK